MSEWQIFKSSNYIVWIYLYEEYENSMQLIEKQSSVDNLVCCYFVLSVVYMGLKLQLPHREKNYITKGVWARLLKRIFRPKE